MEMSKELLAKAKEAKTPEELMAFAKENNMEMTEESAKAYFEQLHPKTGEITDEELGRRLPHQGRQTCCQRNALLR